MRIIHKDLRHGEIKAGLNSPEDAWLLSHIIREGDVVGGRTLRKIKKDEAQEGIRKPVFLKVCAEKISVENRQLRVLGKIVEEKEDIPKGAYHSIEAGAGDVITIVKEKWGRTDLKRIEEACKGRGAVVLVCIVDRESACFGLVREHGYEILSEEEWEVQKKVKGTKGEEIFPKVAKIALEYIARLNPAAVIVASPSFWKDEVIKLLRGRGFKVFGASCQYVGKEGIEELLKREEVKCAIGEARIYEEANAVERLLREIKIDGKAAYGLEEVRLAVEGGNIEMLLVTDRFARENYKEVDGLIENVERHRGAVFIVSSKNEAGRKLDGLGGIGAVLRYKAY